MCYDTDDETRILLTITTLKHRLADFIETDFGLLDELLRLEVLSRREVADVSNERTVYRRNDALLDLLTSGDQCVKFLTALQRTNQRHVVNFITQNGGQKLSDVMTSVKYSTWWQQAIISHLFCLLIICHVCRLSTSIVAFHHYRIISFLFHYWRFRAEGYMASVGI